ncbi:MAG: phage tail tape measure protein [Oceanococcaceae bacterium]
MALDLAIRLRAEGASSAERDIRRVSGAVRDTGAAAGQAAPQQQRVADSLQNVQRSAAGLAARLVGALGLTAAFVSGLQKSREFGAAIAEVSTLLDDTSGLDNLTQKTRELSREFGTSNTEQARALYQIISAGASDAASQTELLTVANKLAVGGVTDIETAADGLTSVLNSYGLEATDAGRVSDALFAAMRAGKTSIGELSGSLGQVTPLAAQAGVSFEEVAAATATLTKGGVSTSQAVTQLRGIISSVLKPTAEAKDLAEGLGLSFDLQALKARGLSGFLAEVAEKTGGNAEQMAVLFGQVEALGGSLALTGTQAQDFSEILASVSNAAGETEKAVEKVTSSNDFAAKQFKAALSSLVASVSGFIDQAITPLTIAATSIINAFNDLPGPAQDAAIAIGLLGASFIALRAALVALGPLLGVFAGGAGAAAAATGAATSAVVAKTVAVRALSVAMRATPWGLAVASIGALVGAYGDLKEAQESAQQAADKQRDSLERGIQAAREAAAQTGLTSKAIADDIALLTDNIESLTGSQVAFYRQGLAEAERYLKAQIQIGVREKELYGETEINLKAIGEQLREVRALQEKLGDAAKESAKANRVLGESASFASAELAGQILTQIEAAETAEELATVQERVDEAQRNGALSAEQLELAQIALLGRQEELTQQAKDLEAAYKALGITSSDTLRRQAEGAREAFETLQRLNEPLADQERAWLKVAEAELKAAEAAGEAELRQVTAALRAEAKTQEQRAAIDQLTGAYDEAGAAAERMGESARSAGLQATLAARETAQALADQARAADRTQESYVALFEAAKAANLEATGSGTRNPDGSILLPPRLPPGPLDFGSFNGEIPSFTSFTRPAGFQGFRSPQGSRARNSGPSQASALIDQRRQELDQLFGRDPSATPPPPPPTRTITLEFRGPDGLTRTATLIDDAGAEDFLDRLEAIGGTLN